MSDEKANIAHTLFKDIEEFATSLPSDLYLRFGSSPEGLPGWQVEVNMEKYGPNRIFQKARTPWYVFLFNSIKNPFNAVLFVIAVVSLFTQDYVGAGIISVMVLLSVGIKFYQELKSARTEEALKKLISTKVSVLRKHEGEEAGFEEQHLEDIVPGDIIKLSAGDMIPADVRLIESKTMFVNQSTLTGESLPIEKHDILNDALLEELRLGKGAHTELEFDNICFLGTNVVTGTAIAIVVATGKNTYLGSMAQSITVQTNVTAFEIGITKVSWLLIKLMAVIAPLVFLINGFTKGSWVEALLFALSVAVGLTPEMLPMVVTTNLAKGAVSMSKKKVIVKNLNSIQDLGAMNILCTDKTGTLTENHIVLIKHLDYHGEDSSKVLNLAFLNSYHQSGLRNMMDEAVLATNDMDNVEAIKAGYVKCGEIPFDFERRRMSVLLRASDNQSEVLMIVKGAFEEMMGCCLWVMDGESKIPINDQVHKEISDLNDSLNEDGMRVVIVAHKEITGDCGSYDVNDEKELVLDGLVTFLDPPKLSARQAVDSLEQNGVIVKVLSGDNEIITRKVCHEVGIDSNNIITGHSLQNMSATDFENCVSQNFIFARLTPMQKDQIVKTLRAQGNVVGFMGDGINDAPAIRSSDVGVSVDKAVDIARENADIILLEQDLTILNSGVEEGRRIYANTMKYIKCTASSNFGNIFSLIGASLLLPFLPMLPIQILILNLIYDLSQTSLPWDNVDREFLQRPQKWQVNDIFRFIVIIGPLSSIFDYATFGLLYYVYEANDAANQGLFQTGWFIESLFTQTLIIQLLRTRKIPFIQSMASARVLITSGLLLLVGVLLPASWLGRSVGMKDLPASFYLWLTAIILGYSLLVHFVKRLYIVKFNRWL